MNFYRLLSEEQVGHMQYIYKIIRIHMHIYIQTDVDTTGIYTFTKINKQTSQTVISTRILLQTCTRTHSSANYSELMSIL